MTKNKKSYVQSVSFEQLMRMKRVPKYIAVVDNKDKMLVAEIQVGHSKNFRTNLNKLVSAK